MIGQRKNTAADIVVVGFALFSMFFGAGNVIFPPFLGMEAGSQWLTGFSAYFIADIGLAMMGMFALLRVGSSEKVLERAGKVPAEILMCAIILCIGPMVAIPRTSASTYEMAIAPNLSGVSPVVFSVVFFAVILALCIKESAVVDIVGKVLTPLLLVGLFAIIIKGVITPLGDIAPLAQIDNVAVTGIKAGYQTMDALAALPFGIIVLQSVTAKGYQRGQSQLRVVGGAALLAGVLLLAVYMGLAYLGATVSAQYTSSIGRAALIMAIVEALMGKTGMVIFGVVVGLACVTTAIALTSSAAAYFTELCRGKISYKVFVTVICVFSAVVSNLGLDRIVAVAAPVLDIVYPPTLVLICVSLIIPKVHDFVSRGAALGALLTSVLDNTDKVIEYSGECARLGIKVLPPDVNVSNGGFTADDKGQIRFGLNAVKNVGRNLIENVVAERKNKPYTSLYDFCKRMHGNELNRRAVECLIKAGAFDRMGNNRHSHVEAVEGILKSIETDSRRNLDGQLDLFSVMSGGAQDDASEDTYEIKQLPEYSHKELLQQEKEVSGLYLSGHPLDAYREQSAKVASHTIKALTGEDAHVKDGERVRIVCAVVKNRMMTTKSNSMMAFTSVEDLTGTMEVIVFPKVLDLFRDALRENAVVVIDGRLSVREDEVSKLLADSIVPIENYDPSSPDHGRQDPLQTAAKKVYIRLPSRESREYAKVVNLLSIFDGDIPVILCMKDSGKRLAAPRRLYTSGHPLFFKELERLVGAENIATK